MGGTNPSYKKFGILGSCVGLLTGIGIVALKPSISITSIAGGAFVIGSLGIIGSFVGIAIGVGITYLLVRYER